MTPNTASSSTAANGSADSSAPQRNSKRPKYRIGEDPVREWSESSLPKLAEQGVCDNYKLGFFNQIARLNSSYPGGLSSYIKTAEELLANSKLVKNPYDGFSPSVPSGENLTFGNDNFIKMEKRGVIEARNAALNLRGF